MKEKHIKKLKKLLINLEATKALTYYYAGDDYYHRLNHTDGYVPDPHPIKTKTCERILSKINKLGDNGEYLLASEMAPVYKDKDFLQKLDRCIEDTQHAKFLYEFYKKAYEAEERAKSIPEEEAEEEKFLLAKI